MIAEAVRRAEAGKRLAEERRKQRVKDERQAAYGKMVADWHRRNKLRAGIPA